MGNAYNSNIQVFINCIPCTSHTDKIAIVTSTREENWCQKRLYTKGVWPEWSEANALGRRKNDDKRLKKSQCNSNPENQGLEKRKVPQGLIGRVTKNLPQNGESQSPCK